MFNQISKHIICFCNYNIQKLKYNIFTQCCSLCGCELKDNDMSTVPYGIYMARKVHQNNDLSKIQQIEKENEKLFKQYTLELNPMKYNSKMMNSIWGMYNRYSVHNLKKIMDDDIMFSIGNQQKSSSVVSNVDKPATDFKNAKTPQLRVKNGLWFSPENFY